VSIPAGMPAGVLGAYQALIVDPANTTNASLTAAFEVVIQ